MTIALYLVLYATFLFFLAACVARVVMYAKKPLHLRWEVYPVPHEAPDKVPHGGSYFEDLNWWEKKREPNRMGELSAMVPEMLFMKALFEFNRPMWRRSFPFHFGLYLLIGAFCLLSFTALLGLFAPAAVSGAFGLALHYGYTGLALAGAALSLIGALALLHVRLTDEKLKTYTVAGDIFNIIFFLVAFGFLAAGYFTRGSGVPGIAAILTGALTFDTSISLPPLLAVGLIMTALLAAYIPTTHMAHFIGKYFTYHSVRWNDEINFRNSTIEKKITECLTYRPTWAAAHVHADGKKNWVDIALINPAKEEESGK